MWQLLLILYFGFGTTSNLLRRVLAQKLGEYNRLVTAVFFILFLLPATVVLSFFFPHNLNVGTSNLFLLLCGSLIWPVSNIIAFHANRKVDVSIFAIISNLSPIFTIAIALPFLHENLNPTQLIGAGLLIVSGLLAAASQFNRQNLGSVDGILICLFSAVVLGIGTAFERFMLTRVDFGSYLIFGWGAQIIWAALLAHKELKKIPYLFSKSLGAARALAVWGISNVLKSITFILALKLSTASIISSAADFLSVAIVIAAYFYLKERKHLLYKGLGVAIGVAGLLLIAK